jgi:hypothetical protein
MTTQYVLDTTTHKRKDEDKQNKKSQHNMCWTPPQIREKKKTNKTKNTTQYVVDDTMHKTKDEDKQNKTHNTICVGHHHAQDQRRRQVK